MWINVSTSLKLAQVVVRCLLANTNVAYWQISLQKSAMTRALRLAGISFELSACQPMPGMGWSETQCCRTPHSLCEARFCDRRWPYDKLCEPTEVLRDCRQCELELGTA